MPKERKGLHHYPTMENEHYLTGTCDAYYDYEKYHRARDVLFIKDCPDPLMNAGLKAMDRISRRLQYIIYKDENGQTVPHDPNRYLGNPPTEIILLDEGEILDWNTEIENGLDHLVVSHRWFNSPSLTGAYRFANGASLDPIGTVFWLAPDIFYWDKERSVEFNRRSKYA